MKNCFVSRKIVVYREKLFCITKDCCVSNSILSCVLPLWATVVNTFKSRSHGPSKPRSFQKREVCKPCFRCGEQHPPQTCYFKNEQCHYCKGTGHISKVCRKKSTDAKKTDIKPQNSGFQYLNEREHENVTEEFGELFKVGENRSEPSIIIIAPIQVNRVSENTLNLIKYPFLGF